MTLPMDSAKSVFRFGKATEPRCGIKRQNAHSGRIPPGVAQSPHPAVTKNDSQINGLRLRQDRPPSFEDLASLGHLRMTIIFDRHPEARGAKAPSLEG